MRRITVRRISQGGSREIQQQCVNTQPTTNLDKKLINTDNQFTGSISCLNTGRWYGQRIQRTLRTLCSGQPHSEFIHPTRKIRIRIMQKKSKHGQDLNFGKKNGGIVRPETFWDNSYGGFEGPQTLFTKKILFYFHVSLSSFSLSSSLFFFILFFFSFIFSLFFIFSRLSSLLLTLIFISVLQILLSLLPDSGPSQVPRKSLPFFLWNNAHSKKVCISPGEEREPRWRLS